MLGPLYEMSFISLILIVHNSDALTKSFFLGGGGKLSEI